MRKYGVIGDPIAHSLSPFIHLAFAKQTQQAISYEKYRITEEAFEKSVNALRLQQVAGLNVTMPLKRCAFAYADIHTPAALIAKAVNTLQFNEKTGKVLGDNTDGAGLVNDIQQNVKWPLSGRSVLILGAGGAAQGIIGALLAKNCAVTLVNRTQCRGMLLAKQFESVGKVVVISPEQLADGISSFDIMINTTPADNTQLPAFLPRTADLHQTHCYDICYASTRTPFLNWALQHQAKAIADGLGMLVEQAALSFALWHQVLVKTTPVLALLR